MRFDPWPGETFVVSTYEDCIDRIGENFFVLPEFKKFANDWTNSAGYFEQKDFMRFFETEYSCSAICEEPLFTFSRSIEEGLPKSCFEDIKDEVRNNMFFLGLSATVSGIFLLVLWTLQYCLWQKY